MQPKGQVTFINFTIANRQLAVRVQLYTLVPVNIFFFFLILVAHCWVKVPKWENLL